MWPAIPRPEKQEYPEGIAIPKPEKQELPEGFAIDFERCCNIIGGESLHRRVDRLTIARARANFKAKLMASAPPKPEKQEYQEGIAIPKPEKQELPEGFAIDFERGCNIIGGESLHRRVDRLRIARARARAKWKLMASAPPQPEKQEYPDGIAIPKPEKKQYPEGIAIPKPEKRQSFHRRLDLKIARANLKKKSAPSRQKLSSYNQSCLSVARQVLSSLIDSTDYNQSWPSPDTRQEFSSLLDSMDYYESLCGMLLSTSDC